MESGPSAAVGLRYIEAPPGITFPPTPVLINSRTVTRAPSVEPTLEHSNRISDIESVVASRQSSPSVRVHQGSSGWVPSLAYRSVSGPFARVQ